MNSLDRVLGSENLSLRLFLQSFPTNQSKDLALLVVDAPRREHDTRFVGTELCKYKLTSLQNICFDVTLHACMHRLISVVLLCISRR